MVAKLIELIILIIISIMIAVGFASCSWQNPLPQPETFSESLIEKCPNDTVYFIITTDGGRKVMARMKAGFLNDPANYRTLEQIRQEINKKKGGAL